MLKIYFEEIFKYKTSEQLERIKQMLIAVNIHIAASSLTNAGFALATASFVAVGMNLSLELSALTGRRAGGVVGGMVYTALSRKQQTVRSAFVLFTQRITPHYTQKSWK